MGGWTTDLSTRIGIMTEMFLKGQYLIHYYWDLDNDVFDKIEKYGFVILITHEPVEDISVFMSCGGESVKENFEIISQHSCNISENEAVFLYAVKNNAVWSPYR